VPGFALTKIAYSGTKNSAPPRVLMTLMYELHQKVTCRPDCVFQSGIFARVEWCAVHSGLRKEKPFPRGSCIEGVEINQQDGLTADLEAVQPPK